jgi:hypothetical protein
MSVYFRLSTLRQSDKLVLVEVLFILRFGHCSYGLLKFLISVEAKELRY